MTELELDLDIETFDVYESILDSQFAALTAEARRLSASFVRIGQDKKMMLPILITVTSDKRHNSTSIRWSKAKTAGGNSTTRVYLNPLAKGRNKDRYDPSSFRFLEPELRAIVMHYEELLSIIRFSLGRNREAYKHHLYTKQTILKRTGLAAAAGRDVVEQELGSSDVMAL
jgi:hypothetical protein